MFKRLPDKISLSTILIILISTFVWALPKETIVKFASQPNPFDSRNQNTSIIYYLNSNAETTLKIFDLLGFMVKEYRFYSGENGAKKGWNRISWNGENEVGRKVSKGGYICFLEVNDNGGRSTAMYKIGVVH